MHRHAARRGITAAAAAAAAQQRLQERRLLVDSTSDWLASWVAGRHHGARTNGAATRSSSALGYRGLFTALHLKN